MFKVTLTGPQGTSTEISFSLEKALGAMKKWEEKTDGQTTITAINLAAWLQDDSNKMTMVSIMYMITELDQT